MAGTPVGLTLRLFGAPEARVSGALLVLNHQKARALLYYVAASGRSHTRDHLATLLWSESPESNARHSLRSSLYHIRQALHAQGAAEALNVDGDLVYLRLDDEACDVTHFRRLLAEGSEDGLTLAVSLYRGPLLQGFTLTDAPLYEDWMRFTESELSSAYFSALERLAARAERREAWDEAITYAQRIVQLDPLSERAERRLIGLYVRSGAVGQALRQYRQFESELQQELGLTPSPEIQALVSPALGLRRGMTPQTKTKTRLPVRTSQALFTGEREDVLKKLLTKLAPDARYVLDVLAVANAPLPFALLCDFPGAHGSGQGLEVPTGLRSPLGTVCRVALPLHVGAPARGALLPVIEDLVTRGLLIETAGEMLTLSHHSLREALVHHLSHLRRQVIHRQLATIIENCPALQRIFPLQEIAMHAVIGGDIERARRYGLRVLDELSQDNANTQVATLLHQLHDLLAPTASTEERLRITSALGRVHRSLGQLEQATFWHRQHLELANTLPEPSAQMSAHLELGELALVANDYQAAASSARAGLAIDLAAEDRQHMALIARGHRLFGAALAMEGSDLAAAERHLQEAVAAHRRSDNVSDLCATLFELGNVAAQRGQVAQALGLYEEAASAAEAAHVHYFLALAHNNFAYHSLLLGELAAAQHALAKGKKLAEMYEMSGAMLHLESTQGEISLYVGEWGEACEAFQQGLALAEELGNLERQAGYRAGLALVARGQEDLEGATSLLEEALSLITGQGYWQLWTRIQLWLAETLLVRGRFTEAGSHLDAALETARAHGRTLLLLQGERLQARLLAMRQDWDAANALFARTLERTIDLGLSLEAARTQAAWGEAALLYAPVAHDGHGLLGAARKTLADCDARAELKALMVGAG